MATLLHGVDRAAALLIRVLIRVYQLTLSPLIRVVEGPMAGCRHEPSCSRYAMECFQHHNIFRASWYTVRRVFRCNPFFEGGYDPVPPTSKRKS